MGQDRRQRAHHENDRQRPEGKDEGGARKAFLEGQRSAAQIAEHEARAGRARGVERGDQPIDRGDRVRDPGQIEHRRGERDLQRGPDDGDAPRAKAAPFAQNLRQK